MGRLSKVLLTNSVLFLVYEFTKRVTISHDSMKIIFLLKIKVK